MRNVAILIGLLWMATTSVRAQDKQATEPGTEARVRAEVAFTPVLQIGLGSGATSKDGDTDVVTLDMKTAADYQKGVEKRVNSQLRVFAVGTGYYLIAGVKGDNLHKIMQLDVGTRGYKLTPVSVLDNMRVHGGDPEGEKELDAVYAIKPLSADNLETVKDLAAKGKTHSVGITYTILPD